MASRKSSDSRPQILEVAPAAAIPGGEFQVHGKNFAGAGRASVTIGAAPAPLVTGSDSYLIVRVPEDGVGGQLVVRQNGDISAPRPLQVGAQIADGLHPIANPAVDSHGNIYATFSGSRGQKTPVSVFQVDAATGQSAPFVSELMNASGLAIDHDDVLYVSSRQEGNVYRVSSAGNSAIYVEGMGVATGIVFDPDGNLYVGDRSGTIFKINSERQIFVHATLEPSVAAYHLAINAAGTLFVTGPTLSSNDAIWAIEPNGDTRAWYRGLGRPQGLAISSEGDIYLAACLHGRHGVVRVTPDAKASLVLAASNLVGIAFSPLGTAILATNEAVYDVDLGVEGLNLF